MTKLSIITVNLNNASGLKRTIESVIEQTFVDHEFIVIDGKSNQSIEVIKKYGERVTYWVSESDQGIYDAMNKGIAKAKGEYLYFLNSGDIFFDRNVLSSIFEKKDSTQLIIGNTFLDSVNKKTTNNSEITIDQLTVYSLNHQAVFFNKDIFVKYGNYYDLKYKFAADYDLMLRALIGMDFKYRYSGITVCKYDMSGMTSSESARHRH